MRTLQGHELIARALCIAVDAHRGVYRADRTPYIDHPRRVARMLADVGHGPDVVAAALLHDVIEDSSWTLGDLVGEGFPTAVVAAVDSVTKGVGETYFDAVARAALDPIGRLVKLADNADNSAPEQRVALPLRKKFTGDRKYAVARDILLSALYDAPTATPLNSATEVRVAALFS